MSIEEIKERIRVIAVDKNGDCEAQHSLEDELHLDFIKYVASLELSMSLVQKAKLVSSTEKIQFERWCA